jgi:hypothetical protein
VAKSQKRSNREAKKPKADKSKLAAPTSPIADQVKESIERGKKK